MYVSETGDNFSADRYKVQVTSNLIFQKTALMSGEELLLREYSCHTFLMKA